MVTVKVEGLRELERNLERLTKAAGKGVLRRAGTKALQPMANLAARIAPKDTETLARSIRVSGKAESSKSDIGRSEYWYVKSGGGTDQEAVSALRGARRDAKASGEYSAIELYMGPTEAGYPQAIIQEFGTLRRAAQPYMRPAWDQDKDALLARIRAELKSEVDKAVARMIRKQARAR